MRNWLVDGAIPERGIHLLGGSPQAGKTSVLYELVRAWKLGEPFFGLRANPPDCVAAVLVDRPTEDVNAWATARDEDLFDLLYNAIEDPWYIGWSKDPRNKHVMGWEKFEKVMEKLGKKQAENMVVIMDVFADTFTGEISHSGTVKLNMDAINHYCHKRNITLIGTVYGVKPLGDKKQRYADHTHRIIGPATLRGTASTLMYLTSPTESMIDKLDYQQLTIVPRAAAPTQLFVERRGPRLFLADTSLIGDVALPLPRKVLARHRLGLFLSATEPMDIETVYKKQLLVRREEGEPPLSESRVRDLLKELVDNGEADRPSDGMYQLKLKN